MTVVEINQNVITVVTLYTRLSRGCHRLNESQAITRARFLFIGYAGV